MKKILFASAALSLMAVAPASAQMMMGGNMGPTAGPTSCVSGGQFVPCPPAGMQPGMAMQEPGMNRRMTRREMREQRRMQQQGM